MKKYLAMLVILSVILMGCAKNIETKDSENTTNVDVKSQTEAVQSTDDTTDKAIKDITTRDESDPIEPEEPVEESILLDSVIFDKSLTGEELIKSIDATAFELQKESIGLEFVQTAAFSDGEGGMIESHITGAINSQGDSYMEVTSDGVVSYSITINANGESKNYTYNANDTVGQVYVSPIGSEDDPENSDPMLKFYDPTYQTILKAEIATLNNNEVIYLEVVDSSDASYVTKKWYSPAINAIIKEETSYAGELTSIYEMTQFKLSDTIDNKLFEVPSNVAFESMDSFN